MAGFLEALEASGADAKLYLKPVGFLDSPHHFDAQNQRLNNSLIWFSQIEFSIFDEGSIAFRQLAPVEDWPEISNRSAERSVGQGCMCRRWREV